MTTRLNRRVEKLTRAACASRVGGAKSLKREITSAPSACFDCLTPSIALRHDLEPLHRVLDVDGQRAAHRGDLVAELAVLVRGADRDRHLGPQLHALGAHAARVQPVAQRAGDDREDDVVDGAAERVLDPLELGEVGAHPVEAAVRADRRR